MKLLVLFAVVCAVVAAEDQKAEDATFVSTYAAHPLTYTAGYPYAHAGYAAPTVYSAGYAGFNALPYSYGYHGYSPLVHSLKKRDTSAAEDQKADDATFVSTYAAHPLTYTAGYPYAHAAYAAPTVYSAGYAGFNALPYSYGYHGYSPLVHSLKKRDTSAAEDQKAEDATFVSTYATHPLTYTAGYPATYTSYPAANLYSYGHTTYSGFPYNYPYTFRTVY